MEQDTQDLLDRYFRLRDEARELALKEIVPRLSKQVLERGANDKRSLVDLSRFLVRENRRETTVEFRRYVHYIEKMTTLASCQMTKINQAYYTFAENISMMLEQSDYWEVDRDTIIEMALDYLDGKFGGPMIVLDLE